MRIGIDARFWNESGVGRYVRNLVWELQEIDKTNEYILFIRSKDYKNIKYQISNIKNNKSWKIVPTNIHWHSIEEQIKFPQILNKEHLDLMHFPYFSVPIFYNKPFVVTIHDLILHHFATGEATTQPRIIYDLKLLSYKFSIKKAAQKAQKIITVSHSTKDEIVKHLKVPQEKIIVTYEGVSPPSRWQAERSDTMTPGWWTAGVKNYLLHVGNLYPHKNMDITLSAIKRLKDQNHISIPLVIAGKEDFFYQRFQRKVKELGIGGQVNFLGEVADTELQYLYQNALALISPSLMEGFDLPVVEAMANNCLSLVSDIPVHKEICKEAAIYFNLSDKEDLIFKLKEIYKFGKDKYKNNLKEGKTLSLGFNWQKMAKETLNVYEDSIGL